MEAGTAGRVFPGGKFTGAIIGVMVERVPGQLAPAEDLIDPDKLTGQYFDTRPDPGNPEQRVWFGTSGHRGTSQNGTFTEAHILAITQAICDYRKAQNISGPVILGKDTHALSAVAERTTLEVLAANNVAVRLQENKGFTPTPVISYAILRYNQGRESAWADGIILTPSHNPPEDGGIKYNPPHGGPADKDVTGVIQKRANAILATGGVGVRRMSFEAALAAPATEQVDFASDYINDLPAVIDMEAIRNAGVKFGVDALGGASLAYWDRIIGKYGLDGATRNTTPDPRFSFMTLDHDKRIRMDCSSPSAMAKLVELRSRYAVAWACDPDADRHGIVTPDGLMNPNHYLAAAIDYLLKNRPHWPKNAVVGKTMVSSSMIDRVVAANGRTLLQVPVGFKWFAPGLFAGTCCFGGEESAGASFLRRDGTVWTTDKDGLILGLLAAEILATTRSGPSDLYRRLESDHKPVFYERIDVAATPALKDRLKTMGAEDVRLPMLGGDANPRIFTQAPDGSALDGVKAVTENGWFCARPSGTENIIKIYAESYLNPLHLTAVQADAKQFVHE